MTLSVWLLSLLKLLMWTVLLISCLVGTYLKTTPHWYSSPVSSSATVALNINFCWNRSLFQMPPKTILPETQTPILCPASSACSARRKEKGLFFVGGLLEKEEGGESLWRRSSLHRGDRGDEDSGDWEDVGDKGTFLFGYLVRSLFIAGWKVFERSE